MDEHWTFYDRRYCECGHQGMGHRLEERGLARSIQECLWCDCPRFRDYDSGILGQLDAIIG